MTSIKQKIARKRERERERMRTDPAYAKRVWEEGRLRAQRRWLAIKSDPLQLEARREQRRERKRLGTKPKAVKTEKPSPAKTAMPVPVKLAPMPAPAIAQPLVRRVFAVKGGKRRAIPAGDIPAVTVTPLAKPRDPDKELRWQMARAAEAGAAW